MTTKDRNVTRADISRFMDLDARWRGERIEGRPLGLTGDEPTEHRRLASGLARELVRLHDEQGTP